MRMRIACAHHLAAVLEYLDVVDSPHLAKLRELRCPRSDHFFNGSRLQGRQRQVVTWGEAHYAANSRLAFGHHQATVLYVYLEVRRVFLQRGEIIFENERGYVLGIS